MKAITEKQWRTAPNGWGQDNTSAEQVFNTTVRKAADNA